MDEKYYNMWFSRVGGISPKKLFLILKKFGSAEAIWKASSDSIKSLNLLSESAIEKIISSRQEKNLQQWATELESKKINYIHINDDNYPKLLKEIHDPPIGIYVRGEIDFNVHTCVSMIGSRKCTEYGKIQAYKISKDLAKEGVTIVSGMAKGLDSVAHIGAIEGRGKTIAVLGCGVDICYPAENKELMENIMLNGCIISEFAPQTKPQPSYFPLRNRIISGLSLATVVVEAKQKSGALITVDQALEQGRDVYAIPGNITSEYSKGTNELIQQGADLVTSATDILNLLKISKPHENSNIVEEKKHVPALAPEEKLVYDCISLDPIQVEGLKEQLEINIQTIQYILTMLEISGHIKKLPGQRYIRAL